MAFGTGVAGELVAAEQELSSEAASVETVDAREQLEAFSRGLESLSADFRQITVDSAGETVEESRGRMYFQAPDQFRWNYLEPFPQVIVGDGEQLWHHDEALEQVTVRPQPPADQSPMMAVLRPELLEQFFRIVPSEETDRLRFEPKGDQSELERARLTLENGIPRSLDIFDSFGQSTRLLLEQVQRNPKLDPALFDFSPPPGVDVLEGL